MMNPSAWRQEDFRVDVVRDASRYWHGHGKVTHIPTGYVVPFEESWDDRTGRRRAMESIKLLLQIDGLI